MKKQKRTALWVTVLADGGLLWFYLTAVFGMIASMLKLPISELLLLPAAVPSFFSVLIMMEPAKRQRRSLLVGYGCLFFLAAILLPFWKSGINTLLNHAVDTVGARFPYEFPVFETGENAAVMAQVVWLWLICCASAPAALLIRKGNRYFLVLLVVGILGIQTITGITPSLFWNAVFLTASLAVWLRGHGERLEDGMRRLVLPALLAVLVLAGMMLFGLLQIICPVRTYQKNETVTALRDSLGKAVHEARYGSDPVLPEGQLSGLASFQPAGEDYLSVTMTNPQSYYLRGFTGSNYTGTSWKEADPENSWKGRDLFYWLHKAGFYGQTELASAALTLDPETVTEERNSITVENHSACSHYLYAPYELIGGAFLAGQRLGEEGIKTTGISGERTYSYEAVSGQVSRYLRLTAALADPSSFTAAETAYAEQESYYNSYVYETCLELPENLRAQIGNLLGAYETPEGGKHADYTEAKEEILYALQSGCTYSEILEQPWKGTDFIEDFLSDTKTGYSVHYASAAVMMFRYYGIPARYVEGCLITPEDARSMKAGEWYDLDDSHAHAWAEYYQDGVGWLPFEVTPAYMNVMEQTQDYQDISGMVPEGSQVEEDQQEETPQDSAAQETPGFDWLLLIEILLLVLLVLVMLLILGFFVWIIWKRQKSRKEIRLFAHEDCALAVRHIFNYVMNILAVSGLPDEHVSLYDYRKQVEKLFGAETAAQYEESVALRQKAVYSGGTSDEQDRKILLRFKDQLWKQVYENGTRLQKLRLTYIYFL